MGCGHLHSPNEVPMLSDFYDDSVCASILKWAKAFGQDPQSTGYKSRTRQMKLQQTKKLLCAKGKHQQPKQAPTGWGKPAHYGSDKRQYP